MLKLLLTDFAIWMAEYRLGQSISRKSASDWWMDVSEAIEEGVSVAAIRARRSSR